MTVHHPHLTLDVDWYRVTIHKRRCTVVLFLASVIAGLGACSKPSSPVPTTMSDANATASGTVVERLDGPPYSYLRLKSEKGEVWAAVPMASDIKTGEKVAVNHAAAVKHFQAKPIDRTFEVVVFGTLERR